MASKIPSLFQANQNRNKAPEEKTNLYLQIEETKGDGESQNQIQD